MRLLDAIVEARAEQTIDPTPVVEVFNIADCRQPQDFDRYIGGIGAVLHTPVVGYWYDGQLIWSKQGHAAREVIADRFVFRSADIVAFVQDWIKARAHA